MLRHGRGENAIRYFDPDHSEDEDRFILLGPGTDFGRWSSAIAFANRSLWYGSFRRERLPSPSRDTT